MRLLLVEDDPMIGESVLDLLRAEQYAVDWIKDGQMAEAALRSQTYDLVLLDLGLPKKDGIDVLRDLRARKDRTPVLIATARDAAMAHILAPLPRCRMPAAALRSYRGSAKAMYS